METLKQLKERYNLELDRIVKQIKETKPKTVVLQFPDGLKPYAAEITDYLENKTNANFKIWLGSCFGACDIPTANADLLVQFGHARWGQNYSALQNQQSSLSSIQKL